MTQNNLSSKNKEIARLKKDNAILRKENTRLRKQNYELYKAGKTFQEMLDKTFKEIPLINSYATAIRELKDKRQDYN